MFVKLALFQVTLVIVLLSIALILDNPIISMAQEEPNNIVQPQRTGVIDRLPYKNYIPAVTK